MLAAANLELRDAASCLRASPPHPTPPKQIDFRNEADAFFIFALTCMAFSLTFNALGHMLMALLPNVPVAGIFGSMAIMLFFLFGGYFIVSVPG
jgi:hypothetical protein